MRQGDTIFAPLMEVAESLSSERRERWERLYMLSDRRGGVAQPLIYPHPMSGASIDALSLLYSTNSDCRVHQSARSNC